MLEENKKLVFALLGALAVVGSLLVLKEKLEEVDFD